MKDICDRCGTFIFHGKCWCHPDFAEILDSPLTPAMREWGDAVKQRQAAYDFREECQRKDEA